MANTILISANWHTGALSQQTISRQYDNNRYAVRFVGYPEASEGNELDYYLLVWMSTAPGQKPGKIAPIQLNSDQWYISNYFTQQVQVIKFQLCVLNEAGTYEAHSPIFSGRIGDSLEHDGTSHDIDVSTLFDAYREYLNELIIRSGAVVIDSTPTQGSNNAVRSGGVYEALGTLSGDVDDLKSGFGDLKEDFSDLDGRVKDLEAGGTGSGLSESAKTALLQLAQKVAYVDAHGQDYYDALYNALYPPVEVISIDAVYDQTGEVYTNDSLDVLKTNLTVRARLTDGTRIIVPSSDYTLSGTLTEGSSTITATYAEKTDTFDVTVTYRRLPRGYTELDYIYTVDGDANFIQVNWTPTALTSFEYKAMKTNATKTNSGQVFASGNFYAPFVRGNGQKIFANRMGTENEITVSQIADDDVYTIKAYLNGTDDIILNDAVVGTCAAGSSNPSGKFSLFNFGSGAYSNYQFIGRLYYFKAYENGTLSHDYVPCRYDGTAGLYDLVTNVFLSSGNNVAYHGSDEV